MGLTGTLGGAIGRRIGGTGGLGIGWGTRYGIGLPMWKRTGIRRERLPGMRGPGLGGKICAMREGSLLQNGERGVRM